MINGQRLKLDEEEYIRPFMDLARELRKNIDKAWCLIGENVGHCITEQIFHDRQKGRILRGNDAPGSRLLTTHPTSGGGK